MIELIFKVIILTQKLENEENYGKKDFKDIEDDKFIKINETFDKNDLKKENSKSEDLETLTNLLIKCIKKISKIINFVYVNREIIEHILQKIDKHTQAFEDPKFSKFFEENYEKENSVFRHFLEHPGLLRMFFIIKSVNEKIPEFYEKIYKEKIEKKSIFSNLQKKTTLQNLNPEKVNHFTEEFETLPLTNEKLQLEKSSSLQNLTPKLTTSKNIKTLQKLQKTPVQFFQQHTETIFSQKGLSLTNYLNPPNLSKTSISLIQKHPCTLKSLTSSLHEYSKKTTSKPSKACYSSLDLWMVLIHTFLYLTNYYGLSSTSSQYTESLGIDKGLSGILQASTPVAAIFGGFLINYLTAKNRYKYPYYMSLLFLFLGDLFYYSAESVKGWGTGYGVGALVVGRMMLGFGGARLMTRKFIAINIEVWAQSQYSAVFVLMSSLGETLGPGLSSVMSYVPDYELGVTSLRSFNIIAFVFMVIWGVGFLFFLMLFKGSDENSEENIRKIEYEEYLYNQRQLEEDLINQNQQQIKKKKFVVSHLPKIDIKKATYSNLSKYNIIYKKKNKLPFLKVYFPNKITIFSLLCFMLFKMLQEAWFTELPKMALFYYSHTPRDVGWYLLASTLYAVPVSLFAKAAKKYPDRYLLIAGYITFITAAFIKINYTFNGQQNMYQFYIGSSLLFCGSLIGEAASIAILAKVISPTLKRGFLNAGLLSGTGDTTARALGNASYTLFVGVGGQERYSFLWYCVAMVMLWGFFVVAVCSLQKLQKYSIIRIFDLEKEEFGKSDLSVVVREDKK